MAKLRKMLCNIDSPECVSLMALMETQSKKTLASWAVEYAKTHYLPIYEAQYSEDLRLRGTVSACEQHLTGDMPLRNLKPLLREAAQIARDAENHPVAQAAARADYTACSSVQTPTSALGFLFYGAAAVAYSRAGLEEKPETYDALASAELQEALASLRQSAVPDEPHPAKINWNC